MTEHYYSKKPTVSSQIQTIHTSLRGIAFTFQTDAGVFSKTEVDFGSRVLISAMELPKGARILDVGCGYGPIGLTAAKLCPDGHVTMIDINERAVELAEQNAKNNHISNVTILQSNLFEHVRNQQFDVILTNPPIRAGKQVVHQIFSDSYDCLKPGGSLWVVIQKKQGAPSAYAKLEQVFGQVYEVTKEKGYRIYQAIKP